MIEEVKKILDKRYPRYKDLLAHQQGTAEEICRPDESNLTCPFCNDWGDCDKLGLKHHLTYCEAYRGTENV